MLATALPATRTHVGLAAGRTRRPAPRSEMRYKKPETSPLVPSLPHRWHGEPLNHWYGRCQAHSKNLAKRVAAVPKGIRGTRAAQIAGYVKVNMIRGGASLQEATRKAVFIKAFTVEKALGVTKHVAKEKAHRTVKTIYPPAEKLTNPIMDFLRKQRKPGNVKRSQKLLPASEELEKKLAVPIPRRLLPRSSHELHPSLRKKTKPIIQSTSASTALTLPDSGTVGLSRKSEPSSGTPEAIVIPNPFMPHLNRATNRWVPPQYSLRQQARLVKIARATGQLHLLPSGPKADIIDLRRPNNVPMIPVVERDGKKPLQFIGEWKNRRVLGASNGSRLYASKKRMFKGSMVERKMYKKVKQRTLLMRSMGQRIERWKTYRALRVPNPLKPSKSLKPAKLPF